ncbi:histidine phosphatase family protein [Nocardioides mesophilus]|uniref:Histidine phosphatase family protein n=1 Tax=Nocardioides mesophilus TaxID=433659 RepID=A0A7G9RFG8_9ACTN|nr:histidine phosphatase family protein [Nocardioides mesophilus]QNN54343.1 histidine phosphatase family protein [Nocardioides mesophilus]
MSQVLLVRHGQASWGAADYDVLSGTGEQQSRVLGAALAARGVRPSLVVRGAMRRHRQTADAAVRAAGWDVGTLEDTGWNEFDHVQMLSLHPAGPGDTTGEGLDREAFQRWFEAATARWTGGDFAEEYDESFAAFGMRVEAALRRTVEQLDRIDSGGTAVVFTSGGPAAWVATSLLGGDASVWMRLNPVTVNASVTKLVVGRRGTTLVSFNDHSHLEVETDLLTYR